MSVQLPRPYASVLRDQSGPLAQMMARGHLRPHFQPICSLGDGSLLGYEALIRGPAGSALEFPEDIVSAAKLEDLSNVFEAEAMAVSVVRWMAGKWPGRLFVNVGAATLVKISRDFGGSVLRDWYSGLEIENGRLVLEISGFDLGSNIEQVCEAVSFFRSLGISFSLGDFGEGHSSLRLWSQVKPDFVKIDRYFTNVIANRPENLQTLRALMQIAEVFDSSLIAKAIESLDDLKVLRDLGIQYGQGYFLGRAAEVPTGISSRSLEAILSSAVALLPSQKRPAISLHKRVLELIEAPVLMPNHSHNQAISILLKHPKLHAVAVVDTDSKPVGLIERDTYMSEVARPYFRDVYGRQSCISLANLNPTIIEADAELDDLLSVLTSEDQSYLRSGYIVVKNGRYAGVGTGAHLVRSVTEMRIETARHANPLTLLPGNVPITEHIERLLQRGVRFVACYADLSDFKAFNDLYGYWRGDQMIKLVARVCISGCDPALDFVGHIGGDDFILLMQSEDWERRCLKIMQAFDSEVISLYDEEARKARGIQGKDRQGRETWFPFSRLAIAAVPLPMTDCKSAEQVARLSAEGKAACKTSGSGLVVHGRPDRGSRAPA